VSGNREAFHEMGTVIFRVNLSNAY
jgi:hypothetical protein